MLESMTDISPSRTTDRKSHIEAAARRVRDREGEWARSNCERQQRAMKDAAAIIRMLVRDYRPVRVWQWGSLLRPNAVRDYSDIDIAMEGVTDPKHFFELLGKAAAMTTFPLDIVQLEKIAPEHAADIRRKGKLVYERS